MSKQTPLAAVTGAGGFIGSHLVEELLEAGWRVRALVHYNALGREGHLARVWPVLDAEKARRLETVHGDIRDARCVRTFVRGADAVFHLAALIGIPYSYTAPQSYLDTNVQGTLNVLEACRDEKIPRLLHTSTSEVYGNALTTPMDESHPLQGQSPYSATKIAADKLVESYACSFDLPALTVRPFNTYGPRQSLRAVIPTIVAQALAPRCPAVRLGALEPVRDFTFVRDTTRAFVMLAEAKLDGLRGKVFNLGTGQGISIGSLAQLILDQLEVKKPVELEDERRRPGASEVRLLIGDNRRIRNAVGWKPQVTLEQGVVRTADWIAGQLERLKPEVYTK